MRSSIFVAEPGRAADVVTVRLVVPPGSAVERLAVQLTGQPAATTYDMDPSQDGEDDQLRFPAITISADQMGGVPCVRGMRIPVGTVVGMIASGMTTDEILDALPDLTPADVQETLRFAAEGLLDQHLPVRLGRT